MKLKAIIFDRDGTLIEHVPYLFDPALVKPLPGAVEMVERAKNLGIRLFLHSNQSGIGRGMGTMEGVIACNQRMLEWFGQGPDLFERVCIAPGHPDQPCDYRKPSPLFAREIMRDYQWEPGEICYVGDRGSDLATADAAGTRGVGVASGLDDLRLELHGLGLAHSFPVFDSLHEVNRYLLAGP